MTYKVELPFIAGIVGSDITQLFFQILQKLNRHKNLIKIPIALFKISQLDGKLMIDEELKLILIFSLTRLFVYK